MKRSLYYLALFALAPLSASGITITVDAEVLKDAGGAPMATTGLVILTAATNGSGFQGPSGSNFVTGDEIHLASWDLSAWATEGVFSGIADNLSFPDFPGWAQNDPLRLYWYPSLTLSSTGPSVGDPYGYYSDNVGIDGSDPWITPSEGVNISLMFFTSDATFLSAGGSNDPDAGIASHEVPHGPLPAPVPDTGGTLLLLSLAIGGLGALRRGWQRQAK